MISITDQLGRKVDLTSLPQRIISLVPSQTELLFDLGLDDEVVGITKFCVHPQEWLTQKTRIGGTKNPNINKIIDLQPDLIIANKEENNKSDINRLSELFPVYVSDVSSIDEALLMIKDIGAITGKNNKAKQIITEIKSRKEIFEAKNRQPNLSVVYYIWKEPWMTAGGDTFIDKMISIAGYRNLVTADRYPELNLDELQSLKPNIVMLSTEPYPFKEDHIEEIEEILPEAKVVLVDGEYFSWFGSRLLSAFDYFDKLNQDVISK